MPLSTERSVRLATTGGLTVDGVIRVRRIGLESHGFAFRLEQRHPVAVVAERNGRAERIPLRANGGSAMRLAWIATPLAAVVARRIFRSRRKKGA